MILYGLVYPQTITLYEVKETINKINTETYEGFPTAIEELLDAIDQSYCTDEDVADGFDCGKYAPTRIINMSYGSAEIIGSEAYLRRQCDEFGKLGLQGVTFTISSYVCWRLAALTIL